MLATVPGAIRLELVIIPMSGATTTGLVFGARTAGLVSAASTEAKATSALKERNKNFTFG